MVEVYELEQKIDDAETEKIWDSIDEDFLNECEKHRQWYIEFTKKERHPIAYQVKHEVEEWERGEPLFDEYAELQSAWLYYCIGYMGITFSIGLFLTLYILGY